MRAARAFIAALAALAAGPAAGSDSITAARYADPTARYDHAVLGDALEWGALELTIADGRRLRFALPQTHVFEDTAPRLADLDGDGDAEVIVVETDLSRGAALAIYDETGRIAATPPIGQTHRWLAPLGAADLDGDGRVEIAYVDRPHLARILRILRYDPKAQRLSEVANAAGHTNHRIGDTTILGGLRACGGVPEIITATPDWSRLQATRLDQGRLTTRSLGPNTPRALREVLACR